MKKLLISFLAVISFSTPALGADTKPSSCIEILNSLTPLSLEYPTIREGLQKLLRELTPLHPQIATINKVVEDLVQRKMTNEVARQMLDATEAELIQLATTTIAQYQAGDQSRRQLLEGYKILLKKISAVRAVADNQIQEEPAEESTDNEDASEPTQESDKQTTCDPVQKVDQVADSSAPIIDNCPLITSDFGLFATVDEEGPLMAAADDDGPLVAVAEDDGRPVDLAGESNDGAAPGLGAAGSGDDEGEGNPSPGPSSQVQQKIEQQKDGDDGLTEGRGTANLQATDSLSELLQNADADLESSEDEKTPAQPADTPQIAPEFKPLNDTEQSLSQVYKLYLSKLWSQILSNYDNSEAFFSAINQYITIANEIASEHELAWATQEAASALAFYHELQAQQISYKEFSNFAASLAGTVNTVTNGTVLRKIKFLHTLYKNKNETSTLNDKELRAFEILNKLLQAQGKTTVNDKQLATAFIAQLIGPLSMNVVLNEYADSSGNINHTRLASNIRTGRVNDLLLYPKLEPYLNFLLNSQDIPSYHRAFEGPNSPVNDSDFELALASELDELPHFYRDGTPLRYDLIRLLSSDMLRVQYRDEIEKSDPRKPKPKRVSVVLVDMSGSMNSANKFVLRNALMAAYLDKAQRDVISDGGQHVVYFILFTGEPETPIRLGSPQEAQRYFNNLRRHPLGAGGDDSITGAVVKAYEMIAAENRTGARELAQANILLLTDAVANVNFESIKIVRDKIPAKTNIKLNALTLGDFNADVAALVKTQGGNGTGTLGEVSHQHIPYPEVTQLLNSADFSKFQSAAASYSDKINFNQLELATLSKAVSAVATAKNKLQNPFASKNMSAEIDLALHAGYANGPERMITLTAEIMNKSLSQTWLSNDRAQFLSQIIDVWADQFKTTRILVLQQLGAQRLKELKVWIN